MIGKHQIPYFLPFARLTPHSENDKTDPDQQHAAYSPEDGVNSKQRASTGDQVDVRQGFV